MLLPNLYPLRKAMIVSFLGYMCPYGGELRTSATAVSDAPKIGETFSPFFCAWEMTLI